MSRRKKTNQETPSLTSTSAPVLDDAPSSLPPFYKRYQALIGISCVVLGLLIVWSTSRRFFSRAPSAQVEKARRMLQIERPRLAIEALAKEDSAEGHYLKAIALQTLGQHEPAREQIAESLSIAPNEVKYQGYHLLLQVSEGKPEAISELIKLYDLSPSATGIAFFATNAFTKKKPPDVRAALQAFDLGITLIDETPEFMSNAMHFAVNTLRQSDAGGDEQIYKQKVAAAEHLIEKLEQVDPKDATLLRELLSWSIKGKLVATSQRLLKRITELNADGSDIAELRIMVELLLGQTESAISVAQKAVTENPGDPKLELMLAETAWQSTPTPEHEKILADLVAKHPENPEFVAKLSLYLGKAKRIPDAVTVINQALARTKAPGPRSALLKLAVGIPLEGNNAELSEQQVAKYKSEFQNPKLIEYFEGRILFLKKDFAGAKLKLQNVVAEQQINTEADRMLATECLIWQQRILQIELANAQRAATAEALKAAKSKTEKVTVSPASEKPIEQPVEKSVESPKPETEPKPATEPKIDTKTTVDTKPMAETKQ